MQTLKYSCICQKFERGIVRRRREGPAGHASCYQGLLVGWSCMGWVRVVLRMRKVAEKRVWGRMGRFWCGAGYLHLGAEVLRYL